MKKDVNVIDLSINLGPITLKNPVMPASGTFGYGEEFSEFFDLSILGAVVTKGISLYPKKGNKPPRIFEGNGYLLNSIGLENVGFEMFVKEKLKFLKKINTVKIVNFFGNNEEEYYILAEKLNKIEDIDAIEVNVSCPNVKHGGIEFGLSEKILYQLIKTISGLTDNKVVMVKLSPVIPDIQLYGQILEEAGADVITITNTLRALNIDIFNKKFEIANISGGISGPFLKPVALKMIYELKKVIKIPVIGVGGIFSADDAIEYLMCGADAVQVGTSNFINPLIMLEIIEGIRDYLAKNNFKNIGELKKCFS